MALRVTQIVVEYVDHDHGHWCNRCQLGTGLRVWVMFRSPYGMHLQGRGYCTECEGQDVTFTEGACTDGGD